MGTNYGALCSDFYVNQKLALKMDLPSDRETILHMMDQVRKIMPTMNRFRRYENELALESSRRNEEYRWLAIRRTSIRTGHVNPGSMDESYRLHRLVLDIIPYHLTVSPLDVDYLDLMFGFDLACSGNHDAIVFEALYRNSVVENMLGGNGANILNVQPMFGISLSDRVDMQAFFEVKTRTKNRRGSAPARRNEPISIFLTVRRFGPIDKIEELPTIFEDMARQANDLASDQLVPNLLMPIARLIPTSST